jgi:hypothetical protein
MEQKEYDGHCTCKQVQFRMRRDPIFVHCCHCTWCQRETGSAFVINAMIEAKNVEITSGIPEVHMIPSNSGKGQKLSRCPSCKVILWSNYAGAGDLVRFVRVGTLREAASLPPDIHIFTSTKLPWVILPPGTPAVAEYYDRKEYWPAESLRRREELLAK